MTMADPVAHYDSALLRARYLAERDKRLRKDGDTQYPAPTGELARFLDDPHQAEVAPREAQDRAVDVVVIGGGFGGLLSGARLRDQGVEDIAIIEQGADFGGTWFWNRYPGLRCDIESYVYMPLLEETGTVPTERYVTGEEIFRHCQAIGRRYRLYEAALFSTRVRKLTWADDEGRWLVETDRGDRLRARFLTVSQGPLARVKLPDIPGITAFKGRMFHTARWDYSYTGGDMNGGLTGLAGKRVAVIGTGATAIQIVPKLAEAAEHLFVFQRTPSAIAPRNNRPTDFEWFGSQEPGWQGRRRDNFLRAITGVPQAENMVGDGWTDFYGRVGKAMAKLKAGGDMSGKADAIQRVDYEKMEDIRAHVSALVADPERAEMLKPWYNYLCKRPLFSDDFLQTFNRPNVSLVDTGGRGVERITEEGLVAGGQHYAVDCIIFATGFVVGEAPHRAGGYAVVGRDGRVLEEKWAGDLRTLHGTQASGFPNLHIVGGTNQGTVAFNFTHTLDIQATHAAEQIRRCLDANVLSAEVKPEAEVRWLALLEEKHVDHEHFYEDCTPGFLNNEGNFRERPTFVGATYGGGPVEYEALIAAWRKEGADDLVLRFRDGRPDGTAPAEQA